MTTLEYLWPIHRAEKQKQHSCCRTKTSSHSLPQTYMCVSSHPKTHTWTTHIFPFYHCDFGKMTEKYPCLRQWFPRCPSLTQDACSQCFSFPVHPVVALRLVLNLSYYLSGKFSLFYFTFALLLECKGELFMPFSTQQEFFHLLLALGQIFRRY